MDFPKTLFHYCSLDSFLSIIRNKTIRLTDIQKSNDRLECKALLDFVKNSCFSALEPSLTGQLVYGVTNELALKHLIELELNRIALNQDILMFVACFSETGDLLSQWRGYADNGRGVSIGFNAEKLYSIHEYLKLGKVTYVDVNNCVIPKVAAEYVDTICGLVVTRINDCRIGDLLNNKSVPVYSSFENSIFMDSVLFKDISFQEEREWRLVLDDQLSKVNEWNELYNWEYDIDKTDLCRVIPSALQFRCVGNDIISYLDVKYHLVKDDFCNAINSIIIGPNCKLKYEDLYQILRHFDFEPENIEIVKSKSSYNF